MPELDQDSKIAADAELVTQAAATSSITKKSDHQFSATTAMSRQRADNWSNLFVLHNRRGKSAWEWVPPEPGSVEDFYQEARHDIG